MWYRKTKYALDLFDNGEKVYIFIPGCDPCRSFRKIDYPQYQMLKEHKLLIY